MTSAFRLANSEGYGRRHERDGWVASPPLRRRRRFRLRRNKRPEVHPPLGELPLGDGQDQIPTKVPPWRALAKTDGQWGRDGEIR